MRTYKTSILAATAVGILVAMSSSAYADGSLQSQIDSVNQIQMNNIQAQEEDRARAIARQDAAEKAAEQRQYAIEQHRLAVKAKAQEDEDAAIKELMEEQQKDKLRDQAYQDQLRQLQIEKLKAKVSRENDYIDADLAKKKAEANVIQSNADVNRNVSEGIKDKLSSEGKADVNVSEGVKSNLTSDGEAKKSANSGFHW